MQQRNAKFPVIAETADADVFASRHRVAEIGALESDGAQVTSTSVKRSRPCLVQR